MDAGKFAQAYKEGLTKGFVKGNFLMDSDMPDKKKKEEWNYNYRISLGRSIVKDRVNKDFEHASYWQGYYDGMSYVLIEKGLLKE